MMRTHPGYPLVAIVLCATALLANGVAAEPARKGEFAGMVRIEGGAYPSGRPGAIEEKSVAAFYIDKTEVTQEAYEKRIGFNPSFFKGPRRPVEDMNWFEAQEYCEKIGKRLPTEHEWEKAARAGTSTRYPWGDRMDDRYAWHKGNANKQTHPVAQKLPNAWGLHDMAGNVWEWTASDHEVQGKVVRGGSWRNSPKSLRSHHRILSLPNQRFHYVGVRCARSAGGGKPE